MKGETGPEKKTKTEAAGELILGLLANGPVEARAMMTALGSHDISERTAKEVKKSLGVQSVRDGDRWVWVLPAVTDAELLGRLKEVTAA